jgi:colicin import membrane protein
MAMTTIPRHLVKLSLNYLRLPLTAAERITGHGDADASMWAPTAVFEKLEADAKETLGRVLRDETLVEEGKLQNAKLEKLRQAAILEAAAEDRREQAETTFERREQTLDERREQAARAAQQREQAVAREKAEREREVREQANKQEAAAAKVQAARAKTVTKKEREARLTNVVAESAAVAQQKRALEASAVATQVDDALERKKAERKSG